MRLFSGGGATLAGRGGNIKPFNKRYFRANKSKLEIHSRVSQSPQNMAPWLELLGFVFQVPFQTFLQLSQVGNLSRNSDAYLF